MMLADLSRVLAGRLVLALVAVVLLAIAPPPSHAQGDNALGTNALGASDTDQIRALIERWTSDLLAGRDTGWEDYWAEDALLMPAGHPRIVGRGNIVDYAKRTLFGQGTGYGFTDWSYAGRDDLAVVTNQITWDTGGSDGAGVFNQMIVLRRGTDQHWRIQAVIFTPTSGAS